MSQSLSTEEKQQYARQCLLPEVGEKGQLKLKRSSVLLIGVGGLGSPVAYYLAAAGIGRIGLIDSDRVELSNLHRQIIHYRSDLDRLKVQSAENKLRQLNPEVVIETHAQYFDRSAWEMTLASYDFIVEATDNFTSKYFISDTCVKHKKAFVHAGISGFQGQIFTYVPDKGSGCYRCLFPVPPDPDQLPDKARGGILGTIPGTMGTLQATEAIKFLLGIGNLLINRLLIYDGKNMHFRTISFQPSERCPACGQHSR